MSRNAHELVERKALDVAQQLCELDLSEIKAAYLEEFGTTPDDKMICSEIALQVLTITHQGLMEW